MTRSMEELQELVLGNSLILSRILSHVDSVYSKMNLRGVNEKFMHTIDSSASWRCPYANISLSTKHDFPVVEINKSKLVVSTDRKKEHLIKLIADDQYKLEVQNLKMTFKHSFYTNVFTNQRLKDDVRTLLSTLANRATSLRLAIRSPMGSGGTVDTIKQLSAFDASLMCGHSLSKLHLVIGKSTHLYQMNHAVGLKTLIVQFEGHLRNERATDEVVKQIVDAVNTLPNLQSVILGDIAPVQQLVPKLKPNKKLVELILVNCLREFARVEPAAMDEDEDDLFAIMRRPQQQIVNFNDPQRTMEITESTISLLVASKFPNLRNFGVITRMTNKDAYIDEVLKELVQTRGTNMQYDRQMDVFLRINDLCQVRARLMRNKRLFKNIRIRSKKHVQLVHVNDQGRKLRIDLHHARSFVDLIDRKPSIDYYMDNHLMDTS